MVEEKKQNLSYFAELNPIYRFKQVPKVIIHNTYSSSSSLNRDSIKVLSWNIAKNNYDPSWSKDFLAIVDRYQPDKIFLQEVRLRADVQEIAELTQMGWAFVPNFIDVSNNTYSGILIASQGDRISKQAVITKHYEPVTNTPKVSLFTEHSLSDCPQSLLAVNTHLINFVNLSKFKAQLQEIESILNEHQGAIILAGDFNIWNKSRWQILSQMAARLNLTPVSFTTEDTKKIKNFLLSPPLDYIFYRGFAPKLHTAKVIDNISSSDHNPLFVELCLNRD
ncbi:endonuclease/exonuclease/phosphatase family protein [Pleurocapsa sp. FMAR1]|uniref:endonuclease/exonuclease/phosphatase family protein n=1 Tax=Pleurocapsa sp. FMAR1 TaxID=3040204 RepID=UPI0029C62C1E|nr:endonuclease/exonuclease/phosphatase family protein [Pleurocapsa sp. FMAR1]